PIFDSEPVSSIGSLAVSAFNPHIVWAGTGEPIIRSHISLGLGLYKSTDADRPWSLLGRENTGRVGRLAIDPSITDIVFDAAKGIHAIIETGTGEPWEGKPTAPG